MIDERVVPGKTEVTNLQKHIARYNQALNFCVGKDVVDAACGTGYGTWLLSQVSREVLGIDIDYDAIDMADKKYKLDNNLFLCSDLTKLSTIPKADVIVSFETIEHLDNPEAFIKKCARSLKKDGTFIYSVPLNEPEGFNPHHKRTYTISQALEYCKQFHQSFYAIQDGCNFGAEYPTDKRFTYAFVVCFK